MFQGNWFNGKSKRRGQKRRSKGSANRQRGSRSLRMEPLEDRRLLAVFEVLNLQDLDGDGNVVPGSFRQAVNLANATDATDTIVFSDVAFLQGNTIPLNDGENGGQLKITQPLQILGPGAQKLTVSAAANNRVFDIQVREDDKFFGVEISGMTITGGSIVGDGDDKLGGAIWNRDLLTMNEVIISNSFASKGGGGVYNEIGSLSLNRSLVTGNRTGGNGGGILNGGDENSPNVRITNTTFTQNNAYYGGGVMNARGRVTITNSTFVANSATAGAGVGSMGNPNPDEEGGDPPAPVVFTNVGGTILSGNMAGDAGGDIDVVGMSDDDPPLPLQPSITNLGFNAIETLGMQVDPEDTDLTFASHDDLLLMDLDDYGGEVPVFLPMNERDPDDPSMDMISPLIDAGDPDFVAGFSGPTAFEARGRHFSRVADVTNAPTSPDYDPMTLPIIDIGAAEVQVGLFVVDALNDEEDGQHSGVYDTLNEVVGDYETPGDFTLREALTFSLKNPETDTIQFSTALQDLPDPTFTPATSIYLTLGALPVTVDVNIEGPIGYELEVDASGTDPSPAIDNADGTRVFNIDDGDFSDDGLLEVSISRLTIMGGDVLNRGGGILNREMLTLDQMTFRDNAASLKGGALYSDFGAVTITNSTFTDNFSADDGGGLYLDTAAFAEAPVAVSLINSTISGNDAADFGGGIVNAGAALTIANSTISNNESAASKGDGIAAFGDKDGTTQVYSTIISGNDDNDVDFYFGDNSLTSLGYNLIGAGSAVAAFSEATDITGVLDPMLAPLANTGGKTKTLRLLAGSPAIDAGDPAVAPGDPGPVMEIVIPDFDQRGGNYTRVAAGSASGTARIDIGAYELQASVFTVDTPLDEDDGDTSVGNLSLREAIDLSNLNPLADTIEFDPALIGATISISGEGFGLLKPDTVPQMTITDSVTINGLGAEFLTINGSGALEIVEGIPQPSRLFNIDDGDANNQLTVNISGMGFENFNGTASTGGVIASHENLTLDDVSFSDNSTSGESTSGGSTSGEEFHGGAIYQEGGKLTVTASNFTKNQTLGEGADGGAIYVIDGDLEIGQNTSFAANSTAETQADGGAIYHQNGVFSLTDSSVTGNLVPGGSADGGGIFLDNSQATISGSSVTSNTMTGSNSEGAGVHSVNSTLTITNSIFGTNKTTGTNSEGGGLYVHGGSAMISDSTFSLNQTTGLASFGGGLASLGGNVTLLRTTFNQNSTTGSNANGGAIHNLGGTLVVRDSTISNGGVNGTGADGGAIWSDGDLGGTLGTWIVNSTVSGNASADRGGGVYNADGLVKIANSTITNNRAKNNLFGFGGGVGSAGNATTNTQVYSSIIAGNIGSDVDRVGAVQSFQSSGYNVVGIGLSTTSFNQAGDKTAITNPLLGSLDNNGGPTRTHAVLEDSPAVNAGDPNFDENSQTPPLSTDQRGSGFARILQGRIDAGAYESNFTGPALPADFNDDAIVDGLDFLSWQRGFGSSDTSRANGNANGDNAIDGADLGIWSGSYGETQAGGATLAAATSGNSTSEEAAADPTASYVLLSNYASYLAVGSSPAGAAGSPGLSQSSAESVDEFLGQTSADFDLRLGGNSGDVSSEIDSEADFSDEAAEEASFSDSFFELLGSGLV